MFGGLGKRPLPDNRQDIAAQILPALRGACLPIGASIAHYHRPRRRADIRRIQSGRRNSRTGHQLPRPFPSNAHIADVCGLECRSRKPWTRSSTRIEKKAVDYREGIRAYYQRLGTAGLAETARFESFGRDDSRRGLFGFGKNKKEARITTEFFINAIHVMAGANALEEGDGRDIRCRKRGTRSNRGISRQFHNYVALPRREAFRIEYWALEEAKLQRMPPEAEFSRKILLVVGGGSGIGREVALLLAQKGRASWWWRMWIRTGERGAAEAAEAVVFGDGVSMLLSNLGLFREPRCGHPPHHSAFGGIDGVINTAAIFRWYGPWRPVDGCAVGHHIPHQRHRQLLAGERSEVGASRSELPVEHGAHKFRQRRGSKVRQRSL